MNVLLLVASKGRRVVKPSAVRVGLCGMDDVQHFVKYDVLDDKSRHRLAVERTADRDDAVSGVVVAENAIGFARRPSKSWLFYAIPKISSI